MCRRVFRRTGRQTSSSSSCIVCIKEHIVRVSRSQTLKSTTRWGRERSVRERGRRTKAPSELAGRARMNSILTELWQDRDIKFDSPAQYLELRRGEFVIEKLLQVEDTKVSRVECAQQTQHTHTHASALGEGLACAIPCGHCGSSLAGRDRTASASSDG